MVKRKEKKNFVNWGKTKKGAGFFALISLVAGLFFMNQRITGNVVFNAESSLNLLPIIGILLILCSVILGVYSLKKREK